MKRTFVVVAAVVGFAASAGAVSLSVATNHVTNQFNVGENVILTVTGDPTGGGSSGGIGGRLDYAGSPITNFVSVTQQAVFPSVGALSSGNGFSDVYNQISLSPFTPSGNITATLTLLATGPGVVNVTWHAGVDFFGSYTGNYTPTGTSFTIVVPEPATAALIGLGLIGLVLGGRRRA